MTPLSSYKMRQRLRLLAALLPAVVLVAAAFLVDAAHHKAQRSAKVSDRARLAAGTVDLQLGRVLELTRFCATSPDLLERVDMDAVAASCGRYAQTIGASVDVVETGDMRQAILGTGPGTSTVVAPYPASNEPAELLALEARSRDAGGAALSNAYRRPGSSLWLITGGQVIQLADGREAIVRVNLPAEVLSRQLAEIASEGDPQIGLVDQERRLVARSVVVDRPLFINIPDRFRTWMEAGAAGFVLDVAGTGPIGGTWDVGYHPLHVTPEWMTVALHPVRHGWGSWTLVSVPSVLVLAGVFLSGTLLWFFVYRNRMKSRMATVELARAEADCANREKSRLLASFAHDIRTPLISLIGSLEVLEMGAPPGSRGIATARGSAETLLQMVDDILELSFLGSGAFRLTPSPVDLRRMAGDLVDQVRGMAEDKGLAVRLDIDANLSPAVDVDRLRLQQALSNILTNAVKYTVRGSVLLSIKAEAVGADTATVTFSVADTGVGLAEDDIPKILREFGRLNRDAERQVQGTGLGLAIVQRILRAMGSRLEIQSSPGQGSVFAFTLTLPVVPGALAQDDALPLAGLTILYAEDEPVIRMVTSRRLSAAGAHVVEVENGADALDQLGHLVPNLLVLDLHMPKLGGVDVIRQLCAAGRPKFPIFVLTAHIAGAEADGAREAGADEVFTKPIQIQALAAAFRAWRGDAAAAPRMLPKPAPSPDLDVETFLSVFTVSDVAFGLKLLHTFQTDMRADVEALASAMEARDADKVRALAHRGLGICQVLGAARLGKMLRAIEDAAAHGDLASVAPMAEACGEVLEVTIAEMDILAGSKAA